MFLCGVDLSDELMDLFKLTDSGGGNTYGREADNTEKRMGVDLEVTKEFN